MAITLDHPDGKGLVGPIGGKPFIQQVVIGADTEEEILALGGVGSVVQETGSDMVVRLKPLSTAVTVVGNTLVTYLLLPSGWKKTGG